MKTPINVRKSVREIDNIITLRRMTALHVRLGLGQIRIMRNANPALNTAMTVHINDTMIVRLALLLQIVSNSQ